MPFTLRVLRLSIWLCNISVTSEVMTVESCDDSLAVEMKFRLINKYQSKLSAIGDLELHYIFDEFEI